MTPENAQERLKESRRLHNALCRFIMSYVPEAVEADVAIDLVRSSERIIERHMMRNVSEG